MQTNQSITPANEFDLLVKASLEVADFIAFMLFPDTANYYATRALASSQTPLPQPAPISIPNHELYPIETNQRYAESPQSHLDLQRHPYRVGLNSSLPTNHENNPLSIVSNPSSNLNINARGKRDMRDSVHYQVPIRQAKDLIAATLVPITQAVIESALGLKVLYTDKKSGEVIEVYTREPDIRAAELLHNRIMGRTTAIQEIDVDVQHDHQVHIHVPYNGRDQLNPTQNQIIEGEFVK